MWGAPREKKASFTLIYWLFCCPLDAKTRVSRLDQCMAVVILVGMPAGQSVFR